MIYVNYDLKMMEMINEIDEGEKLLLHACCAPCSSAVLERLGNYFSIVIFISSSKVEPRSPLEFQVPITILVTP